MKRNYLLAGLVITLLCGPLASAQETRTQWAPIEKSLTMLLNEGWRVISHTYDITYTFLLVKENKFVVCNIVSPTPNNATSRCRALN